MSVFYYSEKEEQISNFILKKKKKVANKNRHRVKATDKYSFKKWIYKKRKGVAMHISPHTLQVFYVHENVCIFISNSNRKDSNLHMNHITNGYFSERHTKQFILLAPGKWKLLYNIPYFLVKMINCLSRFGLQISITQIFTGKGILRNFFYFLTLTWGENCHYSQAHSHPKWLYLLGSHLIRQRDLFKHYSYLMEPCTKNKIKTPNTKKCKYERTMNTTL